MITVVHQCNISQQKEAAMGNNNTRKVVEKALANGNGILPLEPAWVARDFLPPGRRLGLPEDRYDAGERGFICERWLVSTTHADNLHQRQVDVDRIGRHSKDEAYFFPPDVNLGPHPATFFGVHPYIAEEKRYDLLLL
jgi:hypothetical protein